jgi:ankyrin repeat protein
MVREFGVSINGQTPDGEFALQLAASNGHLPIVEKLLALGADW